MTYLQESPAKSLSWAKSVREKSGSSGHSGSFSSSLSLSSLWFCSTRILADFSANCECNDLILQWRKEEEIF